MLKNSSFSSSIQHFKNSNHWTVYGSIAYEAIRMIHSILLLIHFGVQEYGFIASFTSIIELAEQISGGGSAYSLGIFKSVYIKNQKCFFSFVCYLSMIPIFLIAIFIAPCSAIWFSRSFAQATFFMAFIMGVNIIFGTLVAFMRMLLYAVGKTKETVFSELCALVVYVGGFWGAILCGMPITFNFLFVFRIFHCLILLTFFGTILFFVYSLLPVSREDIPVGFVKKLIHARFNQWILRRGRSLLSATLLTPFFALYFGMHTAAFFHFMNKISVKLLNVMKAIVYFSLAPLLVFFRDQRAFIRRRVFFSLCSETSGYLVSGIFLIMFNYAIFLLLHDIRCSFFFDLSFIGLMLFLRSIECYMVLYEQVYNACGSIASLVWIKAVEGLIFWLIMSMRGDWPIYFILMMVVFLQCIALGLIVIDAFRQWGLVPAVGISYSLLLYGGGVSVVVQGCLLFQKYYA